MARATFNVGGLFAASVDVDARSLGTTTFDYNVLSRTGLAGADGLTATMTMSQEQMMELKREFGALDHRVKNAVMKILVESAERIKSHSQSIVPYDTGNLHDAFFPSRNLEDGVWVDGTDDWRLTVGYDSEQAPYAVEIHSGVSSRHGVPYQYTVRTEKGRTRAEAFFLERPAREEEARFKQEAVNDIRAAIRRIGVDMSVPSVPHAEPDTKGGTQAGWGKGPPRIIKKKR